MKKEYPEKIFYSLVGLIFFIAVLHFASFFNFYSNNLTTENFFFRKFNLGEEKNIPTIFSTLQLFFASILLFLISFDKLSVKKNKFFWTSLAVLFLFLASDELLRIHEKIGSFTASRIETSGVFKYAWIIPYGIGVIIIGALCIKPLFQLPKQTYTKMILAGAIFLTGAVLFEMAGGWYRDHYETTEYLFSRDLIYFTLYTIEELLEMIGISFFIYVLLQFRRSYKIS